MLPHPRRPVRGPLLRLVGGLLISTPLLIGCGVERAAVGSATVAPDRERTPLVQTTGSDRLGPRARSGHDWFPLTPGRSTDFRIRRFTVEQPSYIRVTMGRPEPFFGRLATPWVYAEVPGLPVDETLNGLRQYYSMADDGALWFHGAQNRGIMSRTDPPLRQLPAEPSAGATWTDTVFFESFLPGGVPFYSARQTYTFQLSEVAFLDLPGGAYHALRASVVIRDASARGVALATAALVGDPLGPLAAGPDAPDVEGADAFAAARGRGGVAELPALKGMWFARQRGLVARDYPHGQGPANLNITTYERLGEGFAPVPAAAAVTSP